MRNRSEPTFDLRNELRAFVEDYCGCGPEEPHSDPVSEACDDAALMLQQRAAE